MMQKTTTTMTYRGYEATISFDNRDRIFVGKVLGMGDRISFDGGSVDELEQAFHHTVDSYLDHCAKKGKQPDRQYSGTITLRTTAQLHRQVAVAAESAGVSMNTYVESVVCQEAQGKEHLSQVA